MAKGKSKIYASDFENNVDVQSIQENKTRCWCAGIIEIHDDEENINIFNNISDWFNYIKDNCPSKSKIYFHNLGYDVHMILYHLYKLGYKYSEMDTKTGKPKLPQSYSIIGDDKGTFYQLSINFGDTYVLIRDSLKLCAGTLKKIAKDLKVDEKYWKIEEDQDFYRLRREEGHVLTDEEIKYMTNDIMSLAKIMCELEKIGMTRKLTAASYALDEYKKCLHKEFYPDDDETSPFYNKKINGTFRAFFPVLDNEVDSFCRKAYKGGWCYNNSDGEIQDGKHYVYDINSMFPSMLHSFVDKSSGIKYGGEYPIGKPTYFTGDNIPNHGLYFVHIGAIFVVKDKHLPFIQIKHSRLFMENEFIKDSGGYLELWLTKPDFELFFEQYDVKYYEVIDGYSFASREGLFENFIDKFYALKEKAAREGNATEKLRSKTVMNAFYGKTGQRNENKIPHYEFIDDILKIRTYDGEVDDSETVYVPIAAYCTAYARSYIIRIAQKHFDIFQYSDTDSIHTTGKCDDIWVDPYAMGAWDCEEDDIVKARYVRQKTYIEVRSDGSQIVKACGLPDDCKKKIISEYGDNLINVFDYGFCTDGKLMRKKVVGGVILCDSQFAIKRKK